MAGELRRHLLVRVYVEWKPVREDYGPAVGFAELEVSHFQHPRANRFNIAGRIFYRHDNASGPFVIHRTSARSPQPHPDVPFAQNVQPQVGRSVQARLEKASHFRDSFPANYTHPLFRRRTRSEPESAVYHAAYFLLLVTLIPRRRIPAMPVIVNDGLNELLVLKAGHNRRKLVRTKSPLR
jgi:hypothetical protein